MYAETDDLTEYHAALYIRLSKEDDTAGPSQSVTNQQSLLEEFASQHRLPVYDTYIDDGWSGTTFDRPAFRRMLRDIEAKKVDLVITKDLSRLGRDYILTGHYMERYFPEHGVRYISLLDGIDTGTDSTANEITPFRAILNDLYAKDISKKIRSVKGDQQRRGLFIGGKPVYGYKMHPTDYPNQRDQQRNDGQNRPKRGSRVEEHCGDDGGAEHMAAGEGFALFFLFQQGGQAQHHGGPGAV